MALIPRASSWSVMVLLFVWYTCLSYNVHEFDCDSYKEIVAEGIIQVVWGRGGEVVLIVEVVVVVEVV